MGKKVIYMKNKIRIIFFILICLIFVSCDPIEIFHNISFSLDKDLYKKEEYITLKILGELDSKLYKDGVLTVKFTNKDGSDILNESFMYFENVNENDLLLKGKNNNSYEFILSSSIYDNINKDLVFLIPDIGEYKITIHFHADRIKPTMFYCWGQCVEFLQFTVTE